MKIYRYFLHILLSLASLLAFIMGWISFAHSLKPIEAISSSALVPLEPLAPVGLADHSNSNSNNNILQFFTGSNQSKSNQQPRSSFVSGGS
jgi:hypothetical protein